MPNILKLGEYLAISAAINDLFQLTETWRDRAVKRPTFKVDVKLLVQFEGAVYDLFFLT